MRLDPWVMMQTLNDAGVYMPDMPSFPHPHHMRKGILVFFLLCLPQFFIPVCCLQTIERVLYKVDEEKFANRLDVRRKKKNFFFITIHPKKLVESWFNIDQYTRFSQIFIKLWHLHLCIDRNMYRAAEVENVWQELWLLPSRLSPSKWWLTNYLLMMFISDRLQLITHFRSHTQ